MKENYFKDFGEPVWTKLVFVVLSFSFLSDIFLTHFFIARFEDVGKIQAFFMFSMFLFSSMIFFNFIKFLHALIKAFICSKFYKTKQIKSQFYTERELKYDALETNNSVKFSLLKESREKREQRNSIKLLVFFCSVTFLVDAATRGNLLYKLLPTNEHYLLYMVVTLPCLVGFFYGLRDSEDDWTNSTFLEKERDLIFRK